MPPCVEDPDNSPTVLRQRTVASLLGRGHLLLDFDGPVCGVFAGYPAPEIAAELVELLTRTGVELPLTVVEEFDPLEVLRWAGAHCSPDTTARVDDALCAAELRAVRTAEPTPFGSETFEAARAGGVPVAIVSNNSAGAIKAYLAAHELSGHVASIVGRAYAAPACMKPGPEPIRSAVRALNADPATCVLVGDSLSDIDSARAAGVGVIGFAPWPFKLHELSSADAVVMSMRHIVEGLALGRVQS